MARTTLDIAKTALRETQERRKDPKKIWGIPWGIRSLDNLTGGIHRKKPYTMLGAVAATGKTALLCQITVNIAEYLRDNEPGKVAKIISCEMSDEALQQRMAFYVDAKQVEQLKREDPSTVISALSQRKVESGFINDEEWKRYKNAHAYVASLPIEIEDNPTSPEATQRWLEEGGRTAWWGLDYLQKHPTGHPDLVGEDIRGAQILSGKFQHIAQRVAPGLALSSMNTKINDREGHRPQQGDLYGGGKLVHDADMILFLHRPDMWENTKPNPADKNKPKFTQLIVAKNRNGGLGEFDFLFSPAHWSFTDITEDDEE